jgi:hypothetical protein
VSDNNLTQRELLSKEFLRVAADVTTTDKKDYSVAFNISHMTVNKYLRGDVNNIEVAISMLAFFKERIAKRNETIEALVSQ